MNAGVIAVITGEIGSLIATYAFPENLFVISFQSLPELSIWAVHISEKTSAVTLNLFILISEYVGMAVGFGIGLCTLAVAYAQVFGLPGYTPSVNVEK